MRSHLKVLCWSIAAIFFAAMSLLPVSAATVIKPGDGSPLQPIIERAAPGDIIKLRNGMHRGPITISKTLTVEGEPGAVILGNGEGSVVTVNSRDTVVRGVEIRGSGKALAEMDSGVFLAKSATGTRIEKNEIIGNLIGIYIHGAKNAIVSENRIIGLSEGRTSEAGDGISVWNAPGAQVTDNDIRFGRDGIYVKTSKRNVFSGNRLRDLRFAIHYMYADDSEVFDNVSTDNAVGYAIMFSSRLLIADNTSDGDRDHGLLLNYTNDAKITGNIVRGRLQPAMRWKTAGQLGGVHGLPPRKSDQRDDATGVQRIGPEKCVFIYNSNKNVFAGNRFEGCSIGIHFTAGSERNAISGNAFIDNRTQVKYVGTRHLDWSVEGRGNFWSDNPAFDLDRDGIADAAYRPNDMVDQVLWTAPRAKLLLNSPAVQVIRWTLDRFPELLPGGVVDSHPLMTPPENSAEAQ